MSRRDVNRPCTGIGAGIILNGALYRGAHESAGEVGYVIPAREFLRQRYDGFGALENVASGSGIAERARQLLKDRLTSAELASMNAETVFEAMDHGETWAQTVIDEALDYSPCSWSISARFLTPN